MNSDSAMLVDELVATIRGLKATVVRLIEGFQQAVSRAEKGQERGLKKGSGAFWVFVVYTDSLVRLRLFLDQNFNYIETIGLLGVTRYLFELLVWLKLLHNDSRYGLVYYRQLLEKQLDYFIDLRDHLTCEITFLREVDAREKNLTTQRLAEAQQIADAEARKQTLLRLSGDVMREIDGSVARAFTLYGDDARINGYGFEAHLIETKTFPKVQKSIVRLEHEVRTFDLGAPQAIKNLLPKRWNWKQQATLVAMDKEYDFIYSYTSRLLHATPSSLTTNQKNLEPAEIRVFLKYIHVRLLDIIAMAEQVLATGRVSH